MDHRNHIPALALLGLSFTACPEDAPPNPIVGEWGAVQVDGDKFPQSYSYDSYTSVYGLQMIVEDDLAGQLEYYGEIDYGDHEYHSQFGSDLVVDELGAQQYRVELTHDLLRGDDVYYDTIGRSGDDIGDGDPLAAPIRPNLAPAELVLTCTLDQNILTCEPDDGSPSSIIFRRKAPPSDD